MLGTAASLEYAKVVEIVAKDDQSDGMLIILTPQSMTEPELVAKDMVKSIKDLQAQVLSRFHIYFSSFSFLLLFTRSFFTSSSLVPLIPLAVSSSL